MRRAFLLALAALPASLSAAAPTLDGLMQSAAAAYREGRLFDALRTMTRALELDPSNPTAKNYVWTIARKIRQQDAEASFAPGEKARLVAMALQDLEDRRRLTQESLRQLQEAFEKSRDLRSPAEILAGMEGLDRHLGAEFDAERADAQAKVYFNGILTNLSDAVSKNVFVSRKDQFRAAGHLAYYRRDLGNAARLWEQSLAEDPSDAVLRKDLESLRALMRKRESEEKVRDLTQQAETYEKTGYPAEAVEAWKEILRLDPDRPGAKEALAVSRVALEKAGQMEKLKKMTNEGLALYRAGDFVGGAQMWLEVLQIDPAYQQAREWLKLAGKKLRVSAPSPERRPVSESPSPRAVDKEKAVESYKEGILLYSQENIPEAIEAWRRALRLDPDLAVAQQAIRQAQAELSFKD